MTCLDHAGEELRVIVGGKEVTIPTAEAAERIGKLVGITDVIGTWGPADAGSRSAEEDAILDGGQCWSRPRLAYRGFKTQEA